MVKELDLLCAGLQIKMLGPWVQVFVGVIVMCSWSKLSFLSFSSQYYQIETGRQSGGRGTDECLECGNILAMAWLPNQERVAVLLFA